MKLIKTMLATAAFALSAGAFAAPTAVLPGPETPLQELLNDLYVPGSTVPDVNLNQAPENGLFTIEGSGISGARILFEIAGNANFNSFGIYDPYSSKFVEIYTGPQASGAVGIITLTGLTFENLVTTDSATFTSNVFGYYLQDNSGEDPIRYFSQASKNFNSEDQFIAFRGDGQMIQPSYLANPAVFGASSYILAFEDVQYSASDKDFNDFVVYVESIRAVPEPGSLALLGLGLAGLAAVARRKQNQA